MLATRTPAVIPDNLGSILMVIAVSACGFAAQVSSSRVTGYDT